jgi:3D (Asp-Asp-Asp) domain-containing protein
MQRAFATLAAGLFLFGTAPAAASSVQLHGVTFRIRAEVETIPYSVEYRFSRLVPKGRVKKAENGTDGEKISKFAQTLIGGNVINESKIGEAINPGAPAVIHMGAGGFQTSRGTSASLTRKTIMTLESTAYTPDAGRKNPTFITKTGRPAAFGVVAVDPKVIPLNTLVFVEGYGFAIAADTGGAIKGKKIDVCIESYKEAIKWGRRDVRVHVFHEKEPYSRKKR